MDDQKEEIENLRKQIKSLKNWLNAYADINDCIYHYFGTSMSSVDSELSLPASTDEYVS